VSTSRPNIGDSEVSTSAIASDFDTEQLRELIMPVCIDAGLELVELEYKGSGNSSTLRLYIDYPVESGKTVSFEECTTLSREVSALLDVEDPIASRYDLEVSSPGLDRPLRTAAHFRRFIGSDAKIHMRQGLEGRNNFKGVLHSVSDDDKSVIVEIDDTQFDLPLSDISSARLIPDWSALMKGQGKRA